MLKVCSSKLMILITLVLTTILLIYSPLTFSKSSMNEPILINTKVEDIVDSSGDFKRLINQPKAKGAILYLHVIVRKISKLGKSFH